MFAELESRLGHQFERADLLKVALTHRSFHFENKSRSSGHYERMEFLGDAVLDLVMSELLMNRFPDVDEGTLSKWRASLVNETSLSEIARELELGNHLFLGKSEQAQTSRPRLLASAFEAVLAAIYLDAGLEKVKAFIQTLFETRLSSLNGQNLYAMDFKTRLQEFTQKRLRTVPEYKMLSSEGPEHNKSFRYEVYIEDKKMGEGEGCSKKSAEQDAARNALLNMEENRSEEVK